MHTFTIPAPAELKQPASAKMTYSLGSVPEFVARCHAIPDTTLTRMTDKFCGNLGLDDARRALHSGDMAIAAKSDALMSKLEGQLHPQSARRVTVDDVTGSFPNVPAFIAGTPLTMRRRIKSENEFSPLSIVVDLTSSAGIDAKDIFARGVAILTLVRLLSSARPVELWVGTTTQGKTTKDGAATFFKLDTSPMDLARAAFMIAHPCISRRFCYSHVFDHFNMTSETLHWAFADNKVSQHNLHAMLAPAFPQASEMFAVPAIFVGDPLTKDPVEWVKAMCSKYGRPPEE